MRKPSLLFASFFAICWLARLPIPGLCHDQAPDPARGQVRVPIPEAARAEYPKRWALIVGINYPDTNLPEAARKVVPALQNAENDAQAFAELLCKHYGYDKDSVRLLLGQQATGLAIREALSEGFLSKKSQVSSDDSILFFFAGHGYHPEKDNRSGELLPWDVKLEGDIPMRASAIPLEDQVVRFLKASPARHKLVILDCCHSGDIFTQAQQAGGGTESLRYDSGLFQTPAFQAIASSRREQQASDGRDGHSPFTASLLSALTVLPRQQGTRLPITATDLFIFMQSELRSAPAIDQKPGIRWLTPDQGEFHFFPNPKSDFSGYSRRTDDEMLKTMAMAPGTYGTWWFDEMPWFMPSLRARILANIEPSRSTTADWVKKHQLEKSAREVLRALENETDGLERMRARHLTWLLDPHSHQDAERIYDRIARELRELLEGVSLQASDWHFLAVIEHRMGRPCREAYNNALRAYAQQAERGQDAALRLLCLADLGEFHVQDNDYEQAALAFQRALEQRVLCPIPFQVFVICREADAWQQLGRWGEADAKLEQALRLAMPLAEQQKDSPLTAFAFTRRSWAYMEQWKFHDAARAFESANDHLPQDPADREAAIVRFHNRHGLAMARRFTGDPEGALADYRRIATDIRLVFGKLRTDPGIERNFGELRDRLAERLINTLERQADCNIFRAAGDLKDAADDLRRACRLADYLPPDRRGPTKVALLYKQALVLGCRSPYQDRELATAFLQEADKMLKGMSEDRQRRLRYHRELTTAIVQVETALQATEDEPATLATRREKRRLALALLRQTVNDLVPQLNRPIHRDHLELLLFATQCLLAEDLELAQRFHLLADAEVLLALCRHAMRSEPLQTQRYLRHHYDSVVRALLAARPTNVQGVIEAVHEATTARIYDKPEYQSPTLVFFHFDGRFHAFLDVPSGVSRSYLLDESLSLEAVREADQSRRLLPLPRQLRDDLAALKLDSVQFLGFSLAKDPVSAPARTLLIRWTDPLCQLGSTALPPVMVAKLSAGTRAAKFNPESGTVMNFPFALPGLRLSEERREQPRPTLLPKE